MTTEYIAELSPFYSKVGAFVRVSLLSPVGRHLFNCRILSVKDVMNRPNEYSPEIANIINQLWEEVPDAMKKTLQ